MTTSASLKDAVPSNSTSIAFIDLKAQHRRIADRIDSAIGRVVSRSDFIMGAEVGELEAKLAAFAGARYAVGCASGTDALLIPLMARGIGDGDAVFLPAFTFTATAEVVALLGATPVFVDVEPVTFNIDPESLQAAIEATARSPLRIAAVIAVDLFGQTADYPAINRLAADHELLVIEDAAQSFGASFGNARAGALAEVGATSFFPAKPLGCYGDGGAIFTNDDQLAEIYRSIGQHGKGDHKYEIHRVGLNSRLDTLQAAVLLEKRTIFEEEIALRQQVAARYHQGLCDAVTVPTVAERATSVWAQYTIRVKNRDEVARELKEQGIPTAVCYPKSLNNQPPYRESPLAPDGVPVAEQLATEVLSLPMHPYLDEETQDRIIDAVTTAVGP